MNRLDPFGENAAIHGDAIEVMARLPDACVDAIVTDPPYGLEFMGKEWDRFQVGGEPWSEKRTTSPDWNRRERDRQSAAYPRATHKRCRLCGKQEFSGSPCRCVKPDWEVIASQPRQLRAYQSWTTAWAAEAYRILKPGGYMLVMGGCRTHHRLGCGLEDAGFAINDEVIWLYAQGFPKNYDVSKGMDKRAGAEREKVGKSLDSSNREATSFHGAEYKQGWTTKAEGERHITAPATSEAQYWEGYGSALKPAHEPCWLCKKPNEGTYVDNVLKHGCGAMNIDGCRITHSGEKLSGGSETRDTMKGKEGWDRPWRHDPEMVEAKCKRVQESVAKGEQLGRWPANVIVDCYPEEFIGEVVVPEKEIRLHGPPKEGLRGPEIGWERTGERDGDRELWIFTETYFDDEEIVRYEETGEEERGVIYPYPQFVWLRKEIGGVVIEGEAQHWKREYSHSTKGMKNFGGGEDRRGERGKYIAERGLGNGLLGPFTRFFKLPSGDPEGKHLRGGVVIEGEAQLHHGGPIRAKTSIGDGNIYRGGGPGLRKEPDEDDKGDGLLGSYTRFFVIPKPSKAEKNKGCMELYWRREKGGGHTQISRGEWEKLVAEEKRIYEETGKRVRLQARGNIHVTVKPVRLMKWLIRLITPHQHPVVVIDPFCGSGTSLVAGSQLNWEEEYQIEFYGVDKGENNITITNARLEAESREAKQLKLV